MVEVTRKDKDLAATGGDPKLFTGTRECEVCKNGKAGGMRAPPPSHAVQTFSHTHRGNELNHWLSSRLPKGRMTHHDVLGYRIPHPDREEHHEPGGFFSPIGHTDHPEQWTHGNHFLDLDKVRELWNYITEEVPNTADENGAMHFPNAEFNKILGIGDPMTGMTPHYGDSLDLENFGLKPPVVEAGKHWNNRDGRILFENFSSNDYPNIGKWLRHQAGSAALRLHNTARHNLDMYNRHKHLKSVGEGVREGKTPCRLCAGHGTVTGHQVLNYFSHFDDYESIKPSKSDTNIPIRIGSGDNAEDTYEQADSGKIDEQHASHDMDRAEINQKLSTDSAPFGGQWMTNDPLGEISARLDAHYLCPDCTGLGVCHFCGGDGDIPIAEPSLSDEEAQLFNENWPRYKHAHNVAFTTPAQPFMRPGVSASGKPLPSFFQTEPGPGQYQLRSDYTDAPPYVAPPSGLSRGIVPVVRPQRGQMTARQKEAAEEREKKRREARAKRSQVAVDGEPKWLQELRSAPGMSMVGVRPPPTLAGAGGAPTLAPQKEQLAEEQMFGRTGVLDEAFRDEGNVSAQFDEHFNENDKRGFSLVNNETPFERNMEAWDHWTERGAVRPRFLPSTASAKFGTGTGYKQGRLNLASHNEAYKQAKQDVNAKWNKIDQQREVTDPAPTLADPDAPPPATRESELQAIEDARDKDWKNSKKKAFKDFQHTVWRMPNKVWQRREVSALRRALEHEPIAANRELLDTFQRAGKDIFNDDDVENSPAAEQALFNMIRSIHPDWQPDEHEDLLNDHDFYMSRAPMPIKLSDSALMRDALALLKFYDAHTSTPERVGVVGTVASVSSLNRTASAHPNQIAVRR